MWKYCHSHSSATRVIYSPLLLSWRTVKELPARSTFLHIVVPVALSLLTLITALLQQSTGTTSHKFSQVENLHNYFWSRVMWRKRNRIITTHFCVDCSFRFRILWLNANSILWFHFLLLNQKNRWLKVYGFGSKQQLILANDTGVNLILPLVHVHVQITSRHWKIHNPNKTYSNLNVIKRGIMECFISYNSFVHFVWYDHDAQLMIHMVLDKAYIMLEF